MADEYAFPKGELMRGKKGLVMGVANHNSSAWGIASQLAAQGAEIADLRTLLANAQALLVRL